MMVYAGRSFFTHSMLLCCLLAIVVSAAAADSDAETDMVSSATKNDDTQPATSYVKLCKDNGINSCVFFCYFHFFFPTANISSSPHMSVRRTNICSVLD